MACRDDSYPRPQLVREQWTSLDGQWQFAHDDDDAGLRERWYSPASPGFDRTITVPYPPESPASGIADTAVHPVVWYRLELPHELVVAPTAHRVLVHFGAVDHSARVWVDGREVGGHAGGQTPFTVDVTDALDDTDVHLLVVRAEDDPVDPAQPRGKQTWRERPHEVWYERTTGIWQTVWLEIAPEQRVEGIAWTTDPAVGAVAELALARPAADLDARVTIMHDGIALARATATVAGRRVRVDVPIDVLRNGNEREDLLWSPDRPTLLDARVELLDASGLVIDSVVSYFGLRTVGFGREGLLVNDRPYYLRSVLHQGYRPRTHLANTGTDELRAEVELVKRLGFNAVRVHQKVEDPRFLYWADRLGLLVWGETGAAYGFDAEAVAQLTSEWVEIVRRDRSHPCVVAWVPVNESWGFPDLVRDAAQREFVQALASLTRALDPTRPVLSNEGWEHVDSDILGVHDYDSDPARLRARYRDRPALLAGRGPQGRVLSLRAEQTARVESGDVPVMVTEFGGLSLRADDGAFVYTQTGSDTEYAMLLGELFAAIRDSPFVTGFCYTQFMDTAQETNGLVTDTLEPKLPVETIRAIVTGEKDGR